MVNSSSSSSSSSSVKSRKYIRLVEDRCATEGCVGKQHQHRHMSRAEQERQERLFNERGRDWDDFLSTLGKQPEKMHSEIGKRKAHQLAVGSSDAGFNEAAGSACDEQAVNEAEDSLPLVTNSEAAFCNNEAGGAAGDEQAHQLAVGSELGAKRVRTTCDVTEVVAASASSSATLPTAVHRTSARHDTRREGTDRSLDVTNLKRVKDL